MTLALVVGLGNPGESYQATRHNVGQWWLKKLVDALGGTWQSASKHKAQVAKIGAVRYVLPTTYMNHSGESVGALANYFTIAPEAILIAHDELDLSPGQAKLKLFGGHAGHNGLKSIHAALGSDAYVRLRIGVGHPGARHQVSDWVLSKPSLADKTAIDQALNQALALWPAMAQSDFTAVMQALHRQ